MFKLARIDYGWLPAKVIAKSWKVWSRSKPPEGNEFSVSFTARTDIPFGTLQATMQEVIRELERKFNKK